MLLKLIDKINQISKVSIGIAFGLMTLFIFIQVLVRFLFTNFNLNFSVPWTEELSRYIMIWAVFIGGAIAMRKDNMIQVDALVNALPGTFGRMLKIIGLLLTATFFSVLVFVGYEVVKHGMYQTSPVMGIPMGLAFLAIPIGSALIILNILALIIESYKTKKDIRFLTHIKEEEEDFNDKAAN